MRLVVDTHTHSVSSGHAYSTIQELAKGACGNGIQMIAVTDHGPSMCGAPHLWHFGNLRVVPAEIYGVRVLKGVEANIMNSSGETDMPDEYLRRLDFVNASFHDVCFTPSSVEEHTVALINVMKNPYVDAIAHPGNPQFQVDMEKVVLAARDYGKFIEINNTSFYVRTGSEKNCRRFAELCKKHRVRIVCGSDAHISFDVGKFDKVIKILEEVGMPEDLVMNVSSENFETYLELKKKRTRMS